MRTNSVQIHPWHRSVHIPGSTNMPPGISHELAWERSYHKASPKLGVTGGGDDAGGRVDPVLIRRMGVRSDTSAAGVARKGENLLMAEVDLNGVATRGTGPQRYLLHPAPCPPHLRASEKREARPPAGLMGVPMAKRPGLGVGGWVGMYEDGETVRGQFQDGPTEGKSYRTWNGGDPSKPHAEVVRISNRGHTARGRSNEPLSGLASQTSTPLVQATVPRYPSTLADSQLYGDSQHTAAIRSNGGVLSNGTTTPARSPLAVASSQQRVPHVEKIAGQSALANHTSYITNYATDYGSQPASRRPRTACNTANAYMFLHQGQSWQAYGGGLQRPKGTLPHIAQPAQHVGNCTSGSHEYRALVAKTAPTSTSRYSGSRDIILAAPYYIGGQGSELRAPYSNSAASYSNNWEGLGPKCSASTLPQLPSSQLNGGSSICTTASSHFSQAKSPYSTSLPHLPYSATNAGYGNSTMTAPRQSLVSSARPHSVRPALEKPSVVYGTSLHAGAAQEGGNIPRRPIAASSAILDAHAASQVNRTDQMTPYETASLQHARSIASQVSARQTHYNRVFLRTSYQNDFGVLGGVIVPLDTAAPSADGKPVDMKTQNELMAQRMEVMDAQLQARKDGKSGAAGIGTEAFPVKKSYLPRWAAPASKASTLVAGAGMLHYDSCPVCPVPENTDTALCALDHLGTFTTGIAPITKYTTRLHK
ncbi:hypothetical protein DFS34DRAFT_615958 [Phlyctochytrium arcticum]|nr:hypothetical protein DFS34DRAFT_615958 [Phlyctochytrium arcticum]